MILEAALKRNFWLITEAISFEYGGTEIAAYPDVDVRNVADDISLTVKYW